MGVGELDDLVCKHILAKGFAFSPGRMQATMRAQQQQRVVDVCFSRGNFTGFRFELLFFPPKGPLSSTLAESSRSFINLALPGSPEGLPTWNPPKKEACCSSKIMEGSVPFWGQPRSRALALLRSFMRSAARRLLTELARVRAS